MVKYLHLNIRRTLCNVIFGGLMAKSLHLRCSGSVGSVPNWGGSVCRAVQPKRRTSGLCAAFFLAVIESKV